MSKRKKLIIILAIVLLLVGGGVTAFLLLWTQPDESDEVHITASPSSPLPEQKYYSRLSGEEISPDTDDSPLFCIQIPNGLDGARPQVGLNEAKVVFEAIAEAGITRFAAIFQNPSSSVLGPIRSLRSYYLDWDTPFDCSVVHAGGSDDAIAALRSGGYRELDESYTYTWRDYTNYAAPNNLFTSARLLSSYANSIGFTTSDFSAWPRLTPEEAAAEQPPEDELVSSISISYGGYANFNPVYTYDSQTNTYLRSYASGEPHSAYTCPAQLDSPKISRDCQLSQLAPSVVAVIKVAEWLDADGYHHVINTTSSGEAVIFQNGKALPVTWHKASQSSQITFTDVNGKELKLSPGQLWISAIPATGSVSY